MVVIFLPVIHAVVEICVLIFSVHVLLKLGSIGKANYEVISAKPCYCKDNMITSNSTCNPDTFRLDCAAQCPDAFCILSSVEQHPAAVLFWAFSFFEMLWLAFFMVAFVEMVLAGVFASWYWTLNKDNVPSDSISASLYRTVRYIFD